MAGEFPVKVGWLLRPTEFVYYVSHYHVAWEIQYIKSGCGSYLIGNRIYPFRANTLLIIRPNEAHRFIPPSRPGLAKACLRFSGSLLHASRKFAFLKTLPCYLQLDEQEAVALELLLRSITQEMENQNVFWREIVVSDIKKILFLLKRIAPHGQKEYFQHPVITKLIAYIEANYNQDLSLAVLGRLTNVSPFHLAHLFKRQTGYSLKHYILQRRILEAKLLLTEQPQFKVSAVAEQTGFKDLSLFNEHFRHFTGLTPSAYRKISLH